MRILMSTDTVGGVWTFSQELTSGLIEQGHDVALISLGRLPNPAQQAWTASMQYEWGSRFEYQPLDCPLEWMQDNSAAYDRAAAILLRAVDVFRADLIHSNQFCFGALATSVPKLITAHSDVLSWADACRPGGLVASDWLTCYRSLVQAGLDGCNAVVAPTQWMLQALGSHFTLPSNTHVISNGRSIERTQPRERQLRAVTAGRIWDEAKNVKLLAAVDSPVPICIAGDTLHESNVFDSFDGNVELCGPLCEQELLALFQTSAIYVCTSEYEPFGLAPLEAALCGCAVLVNDLPSLREVWEYSALYFNDAASLSALLRELADDPLRLAQAQGRSMEHARQYTRRKMTDAYLALFSQTVARAQEFSDVA